MRRRDRRDRASVPAILLTSGTTIFSMIALSRSVFFGPMAVALIVGLLVAAALTLPLPPALYATWFRVRRSGYRRGSTDTQRAPHLALAAE